MRLVQLRRASQVGWVRFIATFSSGFFFAVALVGQPEWRVFWKSVDAPEWTSAFGTIGAACIALWLGVGAGRRADGDAEKRASAAATIVSPRLFQLRALVEIVQESRSVVNASPALFLSWAEKTTRELRQSDRIIEDRHARFLAELPAVDLRLLVLADSAFESMKTRLPQGPLVMPGDAARILLDLIHGIQPIVRASSNAIFDVMATGGPAPWARHEGQGIEAD